MLYWRQETIVLNVCSFIQPVAQGLWGNGRVPRSANML